LACGVVLGCCVVFVLPFVVLIFGLYLQLPVSCTLVVRFFCIRGINTSSPTAVNLAVSGFPPVATPAYATLDVVCV